MNQPDSFHPKSLAESNKREEGVKKSKTFLERNEWGLKRGIMRSWKESVAKVKQNSIGNNRDIGPWSGIRSNGGEERQSVLDRI